MIYHETDYGTIHCGDSLDVLKGMADESVDCCITSPPYWGLRDYGTAEWEGGDAECEHKVGRFELVEKITQDVSQTDIQKLNKKMKQLRKLGYISV